METIMSMNIVTDGDRAITASLKNWEEGSQSYREEYLLDALNGEFPVSTDCDYNTIIHVDDVAEFVSYWEEFAGRHVEEGVTFDWEDLKHMYMYVDDYVDPIVPYGVGVTYEMARKDTEATISDPDNDGIVKDQSGLFERMWEPGTYLHWCHCTREAYREVRRLGSFASVKYITDEDGDVLLDIA